MYIYCLLGMCRGNIYILVYQGYNIVTYLFKYYFKVKHKQLSYLYESCFIFYNYFLYNTFLPKVISNTSLAFITP